MTRICADKRIRVLGDIRGLQLCILALIFLSPIFLSPATVTLSPPVGVACESAFASRMHRRVVEPRPAAKLRSPIIGERVVQFRARVHHEWPVLSGWFANRAPLEQENLDAASETPRNRPRRR